MALDNGNLTLRNNWIKAQQWEAGMSWYVVYLFLVNYCKNNSVFSGRTRNLKMPEKLYISFSLRVVVSYH